MLRPFAQVDVFTAVPYLGNPLAVVVDGSGLTTAEMQRFAHWTNLSETTFLLPPTRPDADYAVRIFTPSNELPFAGHPTLGSCHAWLEAGGTAQRADHVVQECGVGLVTIERRADERLAFAAPPLLRSGPVADDELDEAVRALGISRSDVVDAAWIDNGPGWLGVLLASAQDVVGLRPSHSALDIGVIGPYEDHSDFAYEVRAFFPQGDSSREDPVTGSLHASAAQWMIESGRARPPFEASQGTCLGRAGRVSISVDDHDQVWVGGHVVTCVRGTVAL
jgi:PhzF family phenazine biosynthesis protein